MRALYFTVIKRRLSFCKWAAPAILLLISGLAAAQPPSPEKPGISRQHWAYTALDGWSRRGLLAGYPAGPLTGPETFTRFEAAALTLRAAEGIGRQYQSQGEMIAQLAAPQPSATTPAQQPGPSEEEVKAVERVPGVYPEDFAMLEKMVAEFRSELADIGTRVKELESVLASTRERLQKVEGEIRRHQVSGYLQFRFTDDKAATASNFLIRRARVNVAGPISPKASYKLQFQLDKGTGKTVAMRDAYIDLATGKTSRLRAGQAKLLIGYELPESSSDRLEPERALVIDKLFPDQRDIGLQWQYICPKGSVVDLALVNGTGLNATDTNDRKDFVFSVHKPFAWGSASFAVYDGRTGRGASAEEKDRLAAGLEIGKKKTRLRGEYITGRDLGKDVKGWYARLSQQMTKSGALYVKYDTFDENTDLSNDLFRRWWAGWAEDLDPRMRLTLGWETRRLGRDFSQFADFRGSAATMQLQAKF